MDELSVGIFSSLSLAKNSLGCGGEGESESKDCTCVPQQVEQQGLEGVMWCFSAHRASFSNLQPPLEHWDRAPESFHHPKRGQECQREGPWAWVEDKGALM